MTLSEKLQEDIKDITGVCTNAFCDDCAGDVLDDKSCPAFIAEALLKRGWTNSKFKTNSNKIVDVPEIGSHYDILDTVTGKAYPVSNEIMKYIEKNIHLLLQGQSIPVTVYGNPRELTFTNSLCLRLKGVKTDEN